MSEHERAVYVAAVADLRQADTRSERATIVRQAAAQLRVTTSTVWRNCKRMGWDSGRQRRADAGSSRVGEEALLEASRIMAKGRNKRGQPNVPMREVHRIAGEQNLGAAGVSYRQMARLLNRAGLGMRHVRAPEAGISRVSLHPNHVWQFDISTAIQWYFRDERGRKLDLYPDAGARFYEGKIENLKTVRKTIKRFLVTDHYSGAWYAQYYYTGGERWQDVCDFFYKAMAWKQRREAYPFGGIPFIVVMDQGPANKTAYVVNLLKGLGVEKVEFHAPRNAKATGSVETRHNHWQRSFEGRLALRPARDLIELNRWSEDLCAVFCGDADRPHSRHGRPPLEMWCRITEEQLRECPPRDVFFDLVETNPRTGTLDNRLWLRAEGRTWLVRGTNVHARQKVRFRLSPWAPAGVRVWDEFERELAAEELRFNDAGFPVNGRLHVWGSAEDKGATAPATPAQQVAADVASGEVEVRYDGIFDDVTKRLERQSYLQRRAQTWEPPAEREHRGEPLMGSLEAREEIHRRLGRALGGDAAWWRARIGDGITRSDLDVAWAEFLAGETTTSVHDEATG